MNTVEYDVQKKTFYRTHSKGVRDLSYIFLALTITYMSINKFNLGLSR